MNHVPRRLASLALGLRLAGAALASPGPEATAPEPMPPPGWTLVFADEFDGPGLDPTRWSTGYRWPRIINRELQAYVPEAVTVQDGRLRLTASRSPATALDRNYQPQLQEFSSGAVTTTGKFAQEHGRWEIRARVPRGRGLWPAIWLMPETGGWPPEIDVMEHLGHLPDRVFFTLHWRDENGAPAKRTARFDGPPFADAFHVFALEWTPDALVWFVDGVERHRLTENLPTGRSFYLLLNLAVGGDWPGPPDEHTTFPATFEIDWVRIYQPVAPPPTAPAT